MITALRFTPPSRARHDLKFPSSRAAIGGPGSPHRSGNRHCFMMSGTQSPALSRYNRSPAAVGQSSYDFIGEFRYLAGPRGLPTAHAAIRQYRRHLYESRRATLAYSVAAYGEPIFPAIPATSHPRTFGCGFPTRSWALITKTVMIVVQSGFSHAAMPARRHPPDRRSSTTFRPRIYGFTTRPAARCWRDSRCRPTLVRPITYMAAWQSNISHSRSGGGPLVEEVIAVSLVIFCLGFLTGASSRSRLFPCGPDVARKF